MALPPAVGGQAAAPAEIPGAGVPAIAIPAQAQPIMPFNEVRIGMKGYGLTVFHGTTVEPFAVEVVSVARDFAPKVGVVWVKCPDARMEKYGPVEGMSGSPIYLWDEGEPHELGQGGRLIGAFAFGFGLVKECLVGVQPIEQMRAVSGRAVVKPEKEEPSGGAAGQAREPRPGMTALARRTLAALREEARARGSSASVRWRLEMFARLLDGADGRAISPSASNPGDAGDDEGLRPGFGELPGAPAGLAMDGVAADQAARVRRLLLPMSVGSPATAAALGPMLEPLGIAPVSASLAGGVGAGAADGDQGGQGAGAVSDQYVGFPPPDVDRSQGQIKPGGVLSIPLVMGDADLAAVGTVTEVLPDGRVLAFGHAMFGQGDIAVPMAAGYVHMIVPRLTTSFKLGGSLRLAGGVVRDEAGGIVGDAGGRFGRADADIHIHLPGQPARSYHYQLVHEPTLIPILAAMAALQSVSAHQDFPAENTTRIRCRLSFAGDLRLDIDILEVNAASMDVILFTAMPVMMMVQNPHDSRMLEKMELTVEVEPKPRVATLVNARLDRAEVEPGDTLGINVELSPYGGKPYTQRLLFKIPSDIPDGDYPVTISDAQVYVMTRLSSRPHRMATHSVRDLIQVMQEMLNLKADALYVTMPLPHEGLALGRHELPRLPSSKRAMIAAPTSTLATPFADTVEHMEPAAAITQGQLSFTVTVKRPFTAAAGAPEQP
jgi:hypothetical protein